jgi:hypothetical protein
MADSHVPVPLLTGGQSTVLALLRLVLRTHSFPLTDRGQDPPHLTPGCPLPTGCNRGHEVHSIWPVFGYPVDNWGQRLLCVASLAHLFVFGENAVLTLGAMKYTYTGNRAGRGTRDESSRPGRTQNAFSRTQQHSAPRPINDKNAHRSSRLVLPSDAPRPPFDSDTTFQE